MPIKPSLLSSFFLVFGMEMASCSAQEFQNGANLSKHTIGYTVGYAYPKFADGSDDVRIAWGFNYGFSVAFEWGKYYNSSISFIIAPMLYYSNFMNTVKRQDQYHGITDKLIYRQEWRYNFNELAFSIPLSYEFPLFKSFRFGAGANLSIPLTNSGSLKKVDYDYYKYIPGLGDFYFDPPRKKEYASDTEFQFDVGVGVNAKIIYQFRANEKTESCISLEYWYNLSMADYIYAHQTRFAISYIHRNIRLKDVREKWDRYLIRKSKYQGG
jgi:hypothetical protein